MKKKILSLCLCICVALGCLFSFAGCSIVKDNKASAEGDKIVLSVDGEGIKKNDVVSQFYNFIYQNYVLMYNGTESSIIEEKFYNSLIKNEIVLKKANEALEDGTISYCEKDEEKVWESVESYFRDQISSYEKDLYDNDESKYPIWLQEANNEEDDEYFESYESPSKSEDKDKGEKVEKLTREDIEKEDNEGNSKYNDVFKAMFNYVSEKEKDENDEDIKTYTEIKDQEDAKTRREAYANFIENMVLNAKAKNDNSSAKDLLLDQIELVYDSYYEAKITELYREYIQKVKVLESGKLSKENIVDTFLKSLTADKQNFLNESDYISVITSDETELILYHNNDKYFTVQHILLKFDDQLVKLIQEDPFYVDMSKGDVILEYFEQFKQNREEIVENYYPIGTGALTDINEEQVKKFPSLIIDGYYDYYTYSKANGYKLANHDEEGAKKMASISQIIDCYNRNFNEVVMPAVDAVLLDEENLIDQNEDIKYILETALTMQKAGKSYAEIKEKVSSLVFIELSWVFSDDGLYNTIYKQLGYVMANYPDDNNNFSHEFVDLSKIIYESVKAGTTDMTDVSLSQNIVITKDGVHIIKLDNVFEQGTSLIDVSGLDLTDTEAIATLMKSTYICNGSDQTVYDYYYDLIYKKLAGDDSTNGSYFENLTNEWLQEYVRDNKISYENKLSYDELMASMN